MATMTMDVAREMVKPERLALRPEEAAAAIGISRAKVYQLMKDGEIPFYKLGGNRRISPDALRAYIARLETEGGSSA
jgi:excisionase family DNA binding protein